MNQWSHEPTRQYFSGLATKLLTQNWIGAAVLALTAHVALWYLPVQMPSHEKQKPRVIRLTLKAVTPPPPQPQAQPQPRKVVKPKPRRRKVRRRVRRRRVRRRRVVRRPRPIPRRVTPRPAPRKVEPLIPPKAVAKATPVERSTPPQPQRIMPPREIHQPAPRRPVDLRPYGRSLYRSILRQKRYPRMAARMGYEGIVVLLIRVSREGQLVGKPRIVRSSGYSILDREAIRMVRAAGPWPAMPSEFSHPSKAFQVPVKFQLN